MSPPVPPPRRRTPSGHDVPIPESVFLALADIQSAIITQGQQTQTWQANHDTEHKALDEKVSKLGASKRADWGKVIGLVAGSIATIVTAIVAARPTLPAPEVRAYKTALEVRIEALGCPGMQPNSQARYECVQRAYSEVEGPRR